MAVTILIDETEAAFQVRVIDYAVQHGWDWMHIGRTGKYAANGAKGTLGIGWPDLTLVRGPRLIFAELKSQRAPQLTQDQYRIFVRLSNLPEAECFVWRPSDWPIILEVLT